MPSLLQFLLQLSSDHGKSLKLTLLGEVGELSLTTKFMSLDYRICLFFSATPRYALLFEDIILFVIAVTAFSVD